jgi:hypothetical protein
MSLQQRAEQVLGIPSSKETLKPDQIVEYEIGQNDKGPQAINVKIIKDAPDA